MQMGKGVEWGVHACALLAPLPPGKSLSLASLAEYHGVPVAYMAKQMQALSRAGIVRTSPGRSGGYQLGRPSSAISLWDIVNAIEGGEPAFRCTEIRQNGPCALVKSECRKACPIASRFALAERAYRNSLKSVSLEEIVEEMGAESSRSHLEHLFQWYQSNVKLIPSA